MERRISAFALVATFLVLAPWCGSLLALTCPAECCCGHNSLADSCQDGACIQSASAAVAGSAATLTDTPAAGAPIPVVIPAAAVVAAADLASFETPEPAYSPPKLFLQNASLLI